MLPLERLEIGESKKRILKNIFDKKEITRAELVKNVELSNLTVTKLVGELIKQGIVVESGSVSSAVGRHPAMLKINPDYKYTIGIDIGSYSVKIGVIKLNGEILEYEELKNTYVSSMSETISIDDMCEYIKGLMKKYGREKFIGIGIGISGIVDCIEGKVVFCPNIRGYNECRLADEISEKAGLPVIVDTTARNMAFAEMYFGAGEGISNQVFMSLGHRTISSGLVVDSKLFRGANGFAGEIGHNRVERKEGSVCTCSNYGCLELSATMAMVIGKISRELKAFHGYSPAKLIIKDLDSINPDEIVESYKTGDRIVMSAVEEAAEDVGKILADVVNVFNPNLIVLGGGFVERVPEIVSLIDRNVKKRCLVPVRPYLRIEKSRLGVAGTVLGGAMQIISEYINC